MKIYTKLKKLDIKKGGTPQWHPWKKIKEGVRSLKKTSFEIFSESNLYKKAQFFEARENPERRGIQFRRIDS